MAEGRLSVSEAAELLQSSSRQVKLLKANFDAVEPGWVHHGNQGRQPIQAIPEEMLYRVIELACGNYTGFNDTHLQEKLIQVEGLAVGRASVGRFLRETRIRSPQKRRPPKYRFHGIRDRKKACCYGSAAAAMIGWNEQVVTPRNLRFV